MIPKTKATTKTTTKTETVTVAGKCCESGDLIQENTKIQPVKSGDILAVLSTGAYNYSMSSNYNRFLKPALVLVSKDGVRGGVKRETLEDLTRNDSFDEQARRIITESENCYIAVVDIHD